MRLWLLNHMRIVAGVLFVIVMTLQILPWVLPYLVQ